MIKKTLGYILALIGIAGFLLWSFPELQAQIPNMPKVDELTLVIASSVVILIGLFLIIKSPSRRRIKGDSELPIYQGKEVVGYRRR